MAKQKFRPTRPGGFSGAKAYIWFEVLKRRRNAVGRTFCDAIKHWQLDWATRGEILAGQAELPWVRMSLWNLFSQG